MQHQISVINKDIPLSFMDFQLMEYDKLLTLAHSLGQPQLGEAVNDAKTRTLTMKRGYEELFITESSSNKKKRVSHHQQHPHPQPQLTGTIASMKKP